MPTLSERLFARAQSVIPGGVNSPVRAWRAVGGSPLFIQRAKGCAVWDADGHSYLDFVGSWGPMIAGHAHPEVLAAIAAAMRDGTSFGAPTEGEIELAERLAEAIPSLDMVRLVSSGTEATMSAIRLARGATGRTRILKFDGCYHGHADSLLVRAGSGAATFGVPDSAGVPEAIASATLIAPYNDLAAVGAYFDAVGREIAAVIVEPVVGNMGVIPPAKEFLSGLRQLTEQHGALLIFDEVITGFRLGYGGYQDQVGVRPDLTCLGKIVGGGLPLAAFGGRRDVMEQLAPLGPVYQAGTLSGNPLAVAAGIATLDLLRAPGTYQRLEQMGAQIEGGLASAIQASGLTASINRVGSMWTLFFGTAAVGDPEAARRCDTALYAQWFRAMIEQGVYLPPSQFEAAFVSLAHGDAEVTELIAAAHRVMERLPRT
ncbi:MAG TPA: glutamate-1-semialdehyde 2,1-aminomutase [Terriglobales bacterium]|nr:glutamate-1-semialdehyde 2,1-aminomutase [Terriglobales bacterium]